jgi:serine/threonine protein phosphatase PrpC
MAGFLQGDITLKIEAAGITDVGRKRAGNEDSIFFDDDMQIYVVSDGMGGHLAGEVASRIVVETLRDNMKEFIKDISEDKFVQYDDTISADANKVKTCIHLANSEVFRLSHSEEKYRGMGATISAVYIVDPILIIGNVGDSPIYLIRNGSVEMVSVLHTVMAEHAALAPKGAKPLSEKYRHMITRAMGVKEEVQPDFSEMSYFPGDTLVLCSDGLSDKASPEDIMQIALEHDSAQSACQALVDTANARGGDDNITVIVIRILGDAEETDTAGTPPAPEETQKKKEEKAAIPTLPKKKPSPSKPQKPKRPTLSRPVAVEYDTDEASFRSIIDVLNEKGFYIKTLEPISEGTELFLTFTDPETDDSFAASGRVTLRTQNGLEVEFINLTPDQEAEIKKFSKI